MVIPIFENSIFPALIQLNDNKRAFSLASERASTGLRVNSADDDVATFIRGITIGNTISRLESRQGAAKTAYVPLDAAIQTLENFLKTLDKVRENLTDTLASGDYVSGSSVHLQLRLSFSGVSQGSNVDGRDLLAAPGAATDITFFVDGTNNVGISGQDISAGNVSGLSLASGGVSGGFIAFSTAGTVTSGAQGEITKVDADIANIQVKLGTLVAARAAIQAIQLADESSQLKSEEGRNNLLRADVDKESATVRALNTQIFFSRNVIGLLASGQQSVLALFRN